MQTETINEGVRCIRQNIDFLLSYAPLACRLVDPPSTTALDRFALAVPYCQTTLNCKLCHNLYTASPPPHKMKLQLCTLCEGFVILDETRPELPPDFIFGPGEEASVLLSQLKTLRTWNPRERPTCLLECILELVALHRVWHLYEEQSRAEQILPERQRRVRESRDQRVFISLLTFVYTHAFVWLRSDIKRLHFKPLMNGCTLN